MPYSSFEATDPKYRGILKSSQWSLCVGAGLSNGLVPRWEDLTCAVFSEATKSHFTPTDFKAMTSIMGWGLDAWLQAALNSWVVAGGSRDDFTEIICKELYKDLLKLAAAKGVENQLSKALGNPKSNPVKEALKLHDFFDAEFHNSSLLVVARWLRSAHFAKNAPTSVLTFNADGLLDVVLSLLATKAHGKDCYPRDEFRRVLRATDSHTDSVPIYHLHGCLAPKSSGQANVRESRENLIFPESGYSRIASTVATWQQTVFLSHAQSHRLLFMGVSMSDPNMRRWLSWCTANAIQEVGQKHEKKQGDLIMGQHVWITEKPGMNLRLQALESSLLHLGIRIAWIDSWNNLAQALDNLLAS